MQENEIERGDIDGSISAIVFKVMNRIEGFVRQVQSADIEKYIEHFISMSTYLNQQSDDEGEKLQALRFIRLFGDQSLSQFTNLKEQGKKVVQKSEFNYEKYLNLKGFYQKNQEQESKKSNSNPWGLEEVTDSTDDLANKWEIVEEPTESSSNQVMSANNSEPTVLLSQQFREQLNSELEEVVR